MPKISIIIPCYKVEKYLKRCLDSVLAQTFDDWEAICVDDGSPDGCGAILDEYAKADNRFKIIHQKNQGISEARNNGKKIASSDYIYFLDSDDSIHPQLLEIAYGLSQKYQADLLSFEYYNLYKEKSEEKHYNIDDIKVKITDNPIFLVSAKEKYEIHFNVWSKFYKKELLDGIDFVPKIHFEDYPHTFAVMAQKPKTVIFREKLYFYYPNGGSISNQSSKPQQIKDYHSGINYIYEIYKNPKMDKEMAFLKKNLIPNLLKQQLGRCQKADENNKAQMFAEFSKELADLDDKGLISWRGHRLTRYLTYKKLIRKYKNA